MQPVNIVNGYEVYQLHGRVLAVGYKFLRGTVKSIDDFNYDEACLLTIQYKTKPDKQILVY